MFLETERMILRDFTLADIDAFHEIFGDAEVMEHTEPPYDREKALDFLTKFCIEREPKGAFAAVLKETGKLIGYVLFKSFDAPEIFEIGWIFNKDYWGRGYAYEICARLVQHGFEDMGLHKICAHATDGVKSVSLMKKLGMVHEGTQRKHCKSYGVWEDLYQYAILRDEYEGCIRKG